MASDEHEALRARIATEEGVADALEDVRGHNEAELRASAISVRVRLGRGHGAPTLESAIAQRQRERDRMAQRLWGSS